jgi:hypothetical protein
VWCCSLFRFWCSGLRRSVILQVDTNVLEVHAASIFRVEVCRYRKCLKMDAACSSEISVSSYKTTLCLNPEHQNMNNHHYENLKTYIVVCSDNRYHKFWPSRWLWTYWVAGKLQDCLSVQHSVCCHSHSLPCQQVYCHSQEGTLCSVRWIIHYPVLACFISVYVSKVR